MSLDLSLGWSDLGKKSTQEILRGPGEVSSKVFFCSRHAQAKVYTSTNSNSGGPHLETHITTLTHEDPKPFRPIKHVSALVEIA